MKKQSGNDFSAWLQGQAVAARPSTAIWQQLPKEALEEIAAVLEHNDKNPAQQITAVAMMRRITERYGVRFGRSALDRYLQHTGRRSWTQKS